MISRILSPYSGSPRKALVGGSTKGRRRVNRCERRLPPEGIYAAASKSRARTVSGTAAGRKCRVLLREARKAVRALIPTAGLARTPRPDRSCRAPRSPRKGRPRSNGSISCTFRGPGRGAPAGRITRIHGCRLRSRCNSPLRSRSSSCSFESPPFFRSREIRCGKGAPGYGSFLISSGLRTFMWIRWLKPFKETGLQQTCGG